MKCPLCGKETPEGRFCSACNGDIEWAAQNQIQVPTTNRAMRRANGGIINIPAGNGAPPNGSLDEWLASTDMPEWLKSEIAKNESAKTEGK